MDSESLHCLTQRLGTSCCQAGIRVATAESCTGGQLAELITRIPGSSSWFDCGLVSYSNSAKQEQLGVAAYIINKYGAVSEPTAIAMVKGLLTVAHAELGVSITGVAGPTGGGKLVGTVCIAWHERRSGYIHSTEIQFTGNRLAIREKACKKALQGLIETAEDIYKKG